MMIRSVLRVEENTAPGEPGFSLISDGSLRELPSSVPQTEGFRLQCFPIVSLVLSGPLLPRSYLFCQLS